MKYKKHRKYLLALFPFLILTGMFEVIPIITTLVKSFLSESEVAFTFDNYISVFTKNLYQTAIINSIWISLISSLVGIIVAFIAAMAVHGIGGRVKQLYLSMLNMVSNFAGISLAFSFIILLGNTGILTAFGSRYGISMLANFPLYSIKGLLVVYIYFQIPLAVMLTVPVFDTIKEEWKHAVSLLGGGAFSFWKSVGLPVILPGLMGTFSVLFANAVSAYATAYALLANNVSILPIRISEQFVGDIVQRPEFGSALAVVLILLMVLAILIDRKLIQNMRK